MRSLNNISVILWCWCWLVMSAQTVIIIKSKWKNMSDCSSGLLVHKVKLDLAFIFLSFIYFFFIPFVSHHKLRPPPDRSVPAVVIHYGSGQSYFSGAVTPILMKRREGGRKGRRERTAAAEEEEDIKSGGNKPAATGRNWWDRGVACRHLGLFKSAPCASYKLQGSILWFRHIVYKWTALLYMTPPNSTWPERLPSRGSTCVLIRYDTVYLQRSQTLTPWRSVFGSKWIALFTW